MLRSLYSAVGEELLAKIAVQLEQAVARRTEESRRGGISGRMVARGPGWLVEDLVCTCGPRDRAFEEQHAEMSIAIVVAGSFQYRSGKGCELMTPGTLLLGNAGQWFECGHEHGSGDRCVSFHYEPEYFERIAVGAGVRQGKAEFEALRIPAVREVSGLVARACSGIEDGAEMSWEEFAVQLAARVLELANDVRPQNEEVAASTLARVTRSVRAIERQTEGELNLLAMAREAGLSPYHFLRTFERLTGVTPHQYVRRMRLRKAAVRLAREKTKVLDVALDCGFGDVSNFNRAFREEYGMSPRRYREGGQRSCKL
jgi:AraC family transcriptional regulator